MSTDIAALVSDNLDVWTSAVERKSGAGRGGRKKLNLYGVERLRALILGLAVRGKLVPQDARDEPASKLLADIKRAKSDYVAEVGLPKQRVSNGQTQETPFELPSTWAWARLGDIAAYIQRGKSPKYSEGSGVFVVSQRCVQWAGLDLSVAKEISRASLDSYESYRFLKADDLLWNSTGTGTIGRVIALSEVPENLVCDSHVTIVRCPWISARYLQSWLASDDVFGQIEMLAAGSTNQIEWTAQLANSQWVPVPPLAEQQRIVAKVDDLMALCDALELQSTTAMDAHQMLVEALLSTLVGSTHAAEVTANWMRLENHFDTLFASGASIDLLQRVILSLAVRGKLAPQLSDEAPAANFMVEIRAYSASRRAKGRIRSERASPLISEREHPFALPNNWAFARFGDVLVNRDAERVPVSSEGRAGRKGEYDYYGASGVIDKIDEYLFDEPLLLIGEDGANLINRSTPIAFIATGKYWVNNHAHVLEALSHDLLRYMELYINAIDLKPYVTGTAQPKMNQAKMNMIVVALPPAAEIPRIVAKVDELMALCDALKTRIADAAETQRHLADAIVERAAA